jgi:hypothetical protein
MALICAAPPTRDTETPTSMRRADVGVEQVGLEVDLAVGDGDDVGRDVGRDVTGLGLDDRQAVIEPAPNSSDSLAQRSSRRLCR